MPTSGSHAYQGVARAAPPSSSAAIITYTYDEVIALQTATVPVSAASAATFEDALQKVCHQMEQRLAALKQRRRKKRGGGSERPTSSAHGHHHGHGGGSGGSGWKGEGGHASARTSSASSSGGGGGGIGALPLRGVRVQGRRGGGSGAAPAPPPPRLVATVANQLNLALNCVTDKNVDAVCSKIRTIANKDETVFREHGDQLVEQLVDSAVMQPVYASVYVQIITFMIQEKLCERDWIVPIVLAKCDSRHDCISSATLSKIVCRGVGWMYAHLFLQHLIGFDVLCKTALALCQILGNTTNTATQEQACEALVSIVLKVGESVHGASTDRCREQWNGPVLEQLRSLWDCKHLNMRVRVRMCDLKDAFGM